MTNDVEEVSIVNNNLNSNIAKKVSDVGIPRLLNLYSKYDVEGTFYFTGTFAKNHAESVQSVIDHGHEVGCHGFSHYQHHSFDVLDYSNQLIHLTRAKKYIEEISGKIEAFRAPALRIGNNTPILLQKLGFKTDSSVASRRFDGPLTSGGLRKLNWLLSPRFPYQMSLKNPYKKGSSSILEIPVSSYIAGYQGTTMRISPRLNEIIGNKLYNESVKNSNPVVFLFHPTELVKEKIYNLDIRRSTSKLSSIFSDRLRRKLKLSNLGNKSGKLLEEVLKNSKSRGFDFISAKTYRKKHKSYN